MLRVLDVPETWYRTGMGLRVPEPVTVVRKSEQSVAVAQFDGDTKGIVTRINQLGQRFVQDKVEAYSHHRKLALRTVEQLKVKYDKARHKLNYLDAEILVKFSDAERVRIVNASIRDSKQRRKEQI